MKRDLIGQTFGRLTVLARMTKIGEKNVRWLCYCTCGNKKLVYSANLVNGNVQSCGCLRKELNEGNEFGLKHGHNRRPEYGGQSPTYTTYYKMLDRCYNENNLHYDYYGGRGITVCDRWRESFENFLEDMGERPRGLTLDRYPDMNGNYEPGNCRWATKKEQAQNTRPKRPRH